MSGAPTFCGCGGRFAPAQRHGAPVGVCGRCGALFLAAAHRPTPFEHLRRAFTPASLEALRRLGHDRLTCHGAQPGAPRYRPCPVCGATMVRRAFARASGILVHDCPAHGVLGDAGWLDDAVAFVEGGGELLALEEERAALGARLELLGAAVTPAVTLPVVTLTPTSSSTPPAS